MTIDIGDRLNRTLDAGQAQGLHARSAGSPVRRWAPLSQVPMPQRNTGRRSCHPGQARAVSWRRCWSAA